MWSALSSGKYTESPVDRPEMTEGGRDGGMKDGMKKEINGCLEKRTGNKEKRGEEGAEG